MRLAFICLLAALLAPTGAAAGTFHVYGLGLNSAGCPTGWQAQTFSPGKLVQHDRCSRWEIQSNRDGTPLEHGDFAGASMFAGDGARFTGFSIRSWGAARNGTSWTMAMCQTPFTGCQNNFPRWGDMSDLEMSLGN